MKRYFRWEGSSLRPSSPCSHGATSHRTVILYVLAALLLLGYHEEGYRHSIDATLYLVFFRFPVVLLPVWLCGLILFILHVSLATRTVKAVMVSATFSRYLGALAVLTGLAYCFAWAGSYVGASGEISVPAFSDHHFTAGWQLFISGLSFEWRNALTAPWASTYSIDKFPLTRLTNLGLVPAMIAALTLFIPLLLQTVLTVARAPILRVLDHMSRRKDSWFVRFLMFVESLLH